MTNNSARPVVRRGVLSALLGSTTLTAIAMLSAAPAVAQSTWTGAVNSAFSDAGNWDTDPIAPGLLDDAEITAATPHAPVISGVAPLNALTVSGATLNVLGPGSLVVSNQLEIGTGGTINNIGTINAGSLILSDGNVSGAGSISAGSLDLRNGAISSIITSGVVTKSGVGTVVLSGTNTYVGWTTVSEGTLRVTNAAGLGNTAGGTTVATGANLSIEGVNVGEDVTLNGGDLTGVGAAELSGTLALTGSNAITTATAADTLTLSGVVSGAGGMTKAGDGTVVLSGTNTYAGLTTVSAGTLRVTDAAGLGNTAGGTTVDTGANLSIVGVNIGAEAVTLNGGNALTGIGTAGLSGTVLLNATSNVSTAGTLTLSGVISGGGGLTKDGAGELVLSGVNTYTGTTTVNAGTLTIAATGGLTVSSTTNSATLVNHGTIQAVGNGNSFTNAGTAGATTNSGTVSNSGTLASLVNSAGTTTTTGTITGAVSNAAGAIVNAQGAVGAVANTGTFNVTDTLASGAFNNNASTSILNVQLGTHTITGNLTNAGTVTVDLGATLVATNVINQLGATITNNGRIDDALNNAGEVNNNAIYNAVVATNTGTINNGTAGTWTGDVTTNAGTINNLGMWTGNVLASTGTINNAATWNGSVINGGIWQAFAAPAGTTHVTTNFTNNGAVTMVDGAANDTMIVAGNFVGNGTLSLDINVGAAVPISDVLKVNGTFSGTTTLSFNAVGPLGYTAADILVVDLNGAQAGLVSAPNLTAELGARAGGLVGYALDKSGDDWVIRSTPNLAAIGGISSNISLAQSTIGAVVNRPSAPFVSGLAAQSEAVQCGPGPWMRATGGTASTSGLSSGVGAAQNSQVDLGYAGAQFGLDLACFDLQQADQMIATSFGLIAGFNTGGSVQPVVQNGVVTSTTTGQFQQGFLGVYATYTNGGLRADLQARIDDTTFTFNNANAAGVNVLGLTDAKINNQRYSLNGSIGYAFTMDGLQIIPTAGFSIAHTTGSTLNFDGGQRLELDPSMSAVGFVGGTIAKTFALPDGVSAMIPFVSATLYNDFAPDPVSRFVANGVTSPDITSQHLGAFAEISGGLNYIRVLDGEIGGGQQFNASVRVDGKISDRLEAVGVTGQIRVQF